MIFLIIYIVGAVILWPIFARADYRSSSYKEPGMSVLSGFMLALLWPIVATITLITVLFSSILPKLFGLN